MYAHMVTLMAEMETTWDGLPVARERPYACAVVVWREIDGRREFLLLHRLAPGGPSHEGEWAWTPPSGAGQPGEAPDAAATRELEEIGATLPLTPLPDASASGDVALYVAEAPPDTEIVLDDEHDRFVWLPMRRGTPEVPASGGRDGPRQRSSVDRGSRGGALIALAGVSYRRGRRLRQRTRMHPEARAPAVGPCAGTASGERRRLAKVAGWA